MKIGKYIIPVCLAGIAVFVLGTSVGSKQPAKKEQLVKKQQQQQPVQEQQKNIKVSKVYDYVLDVGIYESTDFEYAQKEIKSKYDKWGGLCTAVAKVTDDGTTLVGRNMDLYISNKPAYIFRTKVSGLYETIGLTYNNMTGTDYSEVAVNGMPEGFYKMIPFMATDVLNSEGLYIETNMRNDEYWATGKNKFGCSGTKPGAETRICSCVLPQYLGQRCATVDEAINLVNELDIYSMNSEDLAWDFCFMMADATGHYGLMEIANNKVVWLDGQQAQTNFYINEEFAKNEELKCGVGRYETVMAGIDAVQTQDDMYNLISSVSYSQRYLPETSVFDVRSEFVGIYDNWTYDYVMKEENREEVMSTINGFGEKFSNYTRQELQDKNAYWESTFTEVVDPAEKTIRVRLFENESMMYKITFDGIKKITEITD